MKNLYPYFSQNPLDRLDNLRGNNQKILEFMNTNSSLFLIFDGNNILVDEENRQCLFSKKILEQYNINKKEIVFLGLYEDKYYFAFSLNEDNKTQLSKIALREFIVLDYLDQEMLGILAQASSVLNWHESHKFCSNCGKSTEIVNSGWRRDCPSCKKEHFPRVDPAVIMLVTFDEYCLIGRGVNFKNKRYSCLAGYVDSGETLEEAAKRELYEEAGVEGYDVEYLFSQPWPFPSTLMIGMRMKAKSKELNIDTNEIADAFWVHKDDIKAVLDGKEGYSFTLPDKRAIARNLLDIWVEEK